MDLEIGKKLAAKVLQFPPTITFIYQWVDWEVIRTPSKVNLEFLKSLREENVITPEGEYE